MLYNAIEHVHMRCIGLTWRVQVSTRAVSTEGYFLGRLSDLRDANNKFES
jgi:hypothetical protein